MPSSTLLVVLSLLAAATTATAAGFCSSGSYGIISGTTVVHQRITIKTSSDIEFYNYCPYPSTVQGLFVVACSDVWQPTVQVQSLSTARVLTNLPGNTNVEVQGYAFCSGGARSTHSENDVLALSGGFLPVDGLMRPNGVLPFLNVGMPVVGALPGGADLVPVREVVPADRYQQLNWN